MDEIIKIRRQIHQNPELSFCEFNTAKIIADYLESLGILPKRGVAKTGVTADICSGKEGKTLLLRADMDALPVTECTGLEYASKNKGIMHACGHDVHIAVLLACARLLCKNKEKFRGRVRLAFQPGEETTGGAQLMINEGVLQNPPVDAAFAYHITNEVKTGSVIVKKGGFMASPDNFYLTVHGKGGHGGQPELCKNPVVIASELVGMLNNIECEKPFAVSVCSLNSGTSENVIPDTAELKGTARTIDPDTRRFIYEEIGRVKTVCEEKHGVKIDYRYLWLYPPLVNDGELTEKFISTAYRVLGEDKVVFAQKADMIGEDFSYFASAVPGCMVKLGGASAPLHSAYLTVDEDAVFTGADLMFKFACDFLNDK